MVKAVALRDVAVIAEFDSKLQATDWDGAGRVFSCGFEIAVKRIFSADTDVREISRWSAEISARLGSQKVAPTLQVEALIRSALGEPVEISDIPHATVNTIRFLVISAGAEDLGWTPDEVESVAVAAERRCAVDRGARPTIATPDA